MQSKHQGNSVSFSTQSELRSEKKNETYFLPHFTLKNTKVHQSEILPGAGYAVCGRSSLFAVFLGWVVHSVTGQQREDEVRRLGAEVCLAFHLAGLSDLTKLFIIHTYGKKETTNMDFFPCYNQTEKHSCLFLPVDDLPPTFSENYTSSQV